MFKANSIADNIAYNLQKLKCYQASKVYHEECAHVFPVWADQISELMDKLGAKAERRSFDGNVEIYKDMATCIEGSVNLLEDLRIKVLKAIDVLDYDINNKEVVLMLEDLSNKILDLLYKNNIWYDYSRYYVDKGKELQGSLKFEDFADFD